MGGAGARVAIVWAGERDAAGQSPALDHTRLSAIAAALRDTGLDPVPVAYSDAYLESARRELLDVDAALVWVNPIIAPGQDRRHLDALLGEVAAAGVWVSAHPDVIDAMGTKEILYTARDLLFGSDARRYASNAELHARFPESLRAGGARVLKRARGNGGNAVWKVEWLGAEPAARVRVRHAQRGSQPEELALTDLFQRFERYLDRGGVLIDQPFQARLADGMVRCYFVGERVAGFGEQLVNALVPAPEDGGAAPEPGRRLYYPPTREDFQRLKALAEDRWLPALLSRVGVDRAALPVIWDADFLYGPRDAEGLDSYVLCEINVSAVFPFPDEALQPLATEVRRRLDAR